MKKRIITYGTFDGFHKGHENMINKCLPNINDVYVGVASDKYVSSKGKKPLFNEKERMERISIIPGVKEVFLEEDLMQWDEDYIKYGADRIIMGSDHIGELDYFITEKNFNLSYVSRTKGVSTTDIKVELSSRNIGLVYLEDNKRNWSEIVLKAKSENDLVIVGVLTSTFEELADMHIKIKEIELLFNPFITYLVSSKNDKENDLQRFNVSRFYE